MNKFKTILPILIIFIFGAGLFVFLYLNMNKVYNNKNGEGNVENINNKTNLEEDEIEKIGEKTFTIANLLENKYIRSVFDYWKEIFIDENDEFTLEKDFDKYGDFNIKEKYIGGLENIKIDKTFSFSHSRWSSFDHALIAISKSGDLYYVVKENDAYTFKRVENLSKVTNIYIDNIYEETLRYSDKYRDVQYVFFVEIDNEKLIPVTYTYNEDESINIVVNDKDNVEKYLKFKERLNYFYYSDSYGMFLYISFSDKLHYSNDINCEKVNIDKAIVDEKGNDILVKQLYIISKKDYIKMYILTKDNYIYTIEYKIVYNDNMFPSLICENIDYTATKLNNKKVNRVTKENDLKLNISYEDGSFDEISADIAISNSNLYN